MSLSSTASTRTPSSARPATARAAPTPGAAMSSWTTLCCAASANVSVTLNSLPTPGVLVTSTSPPNSFARCLTIDRPSPVPP